MIAAPELRDYNQQREGFCIFRLCDLIIDLHCQIESLIE